MTDDITALLRRASPASVTDLDLNRARREGRARARRRATVTVASSALAVTSAAVVIMNWPTVGGVSVDPGPGGPDAAAERAAAGCVSLPVDEPDTRNHFEPDSAPPAEAMYDVPLPAAGDHLAVPSGVPDGIAAAPLDVRAVVHNLEHGAIAIWIDPDELTPETMADIAAWATTRRDQGFSPNEAGVGLLVSPVPTGSPNVAAISLRAWGVAMDCDSWNRVVADDFVANHYGTRGNAPEGSFGPYPTPDPLG